MSRTSMQLPVLAIVSVAIACASPPKETSDAGAPKETAVGEAPKETAVVGAPIETGAAAAPVPDIAYMVAPLEAGDVFAVDSAPGHGGGGHLKARDHCYYDTEKKQFVCDFQADSAPGHGGGPHKAASTDSAVGHGGGPHKAASDSAVGHGGGGHKVALLMECKEKVKDPNRVVCTAPVPKR